MFLNVNSSEVCRRRYELCTRPPAVALEKEDKTLSGCVRGCSRSGLYSPECGRVSSRVGNDAFYHRGFPHTRTREAYRGPEAKNPVMRGQHTATPIEWLA